MMENYQSLFFFFWRQSGFILLANEKIEVIKQRLWVTGDFRLQKTKRIFTLKRKEKGTVCTCANALKVT